MYKNYVFDFGGVLFKFIEKDMTSHFFDSKDEIETVAPIVFDRLYWDRLDKGTITDEEVLDGIKKRLPKNLCNRACELYLHCFEHLEEVQGMRNLIEKIRGSGKKLYLLSNISKSFAKDYKNIPEIASVLSLFDGLVLSGTINMVKPDENIFEYLCETYSVTPEESVFIDDNPKNIATAKKLGFGTFLFNGDAEALSDFLEQ